MNANELRIGNWVGTFKPHKVNGIYLSHFTAADESGLQQNSQQYNLLPIPLTPEILEKIKFSGMIFPAQLSVSNTGKYYWGNGVDIEIKHLHQLQNLYFAITGEELEINLNQ